MRDPYEVLGVARDAPAKEIKAAFRRLAKKHHPDQNRDDPKAQERFAEANQAYEVLGDDDKRAQFDRGEIDAAGKPRFAGFEGAGRAGADPFAAFRRGGGGDPGAMRFEFRSAGPGAGPFSEHDLFSEIFGQGFAQKPGARGHDPRAGQGGDVATTLEVTLEDVANAARVTAQFPDGRRLAVKLPAFVEDGQVIRLKGQGQPSPLGRPGDALVTIRFARHPRYRAEGRDLHVELPVDLPDAVLGAKLPVETPAGRIAVTVPPWSGSDRRLRLKGRGLPLKSGGHGDLYVQVSVRLPEGDADLEALMRRLRAHDRDTA